MLMFLASIKFSLKRFTSFACPPKATTVRMPPKTSSAIAPAIPYAIDSLLDNLDDILNKFYSYSLRQNSKMVNTSIHNF